MSDEMKLFREEKIYSDKTIIDKLEVLFKQKKKIKFRLRDDPSYEVRGEIINLITKVGDLTFQDGKIKTKKRKENKSEDIYYPNEEKCFSIKFEEGTEMIFSVDEILPHTLFPLEYNPIVNFNRVQIPEKLKNFIFKRDDYECKLNLDGCTKIAEHIDHIIPVSKGGLNTPENLQASCSNCNLKKGSKVIY